MTDLNNVTVLTSSAGGVGVSTLTLLMAKVRSESPVFAVNGITDSVAVVDLSGRLVALSDSDGGSAGLALDTNVSSHYDQVGFAESHARQILPNVDVFSAGLGGSIANPIDVIELLSDLYGVVIIDASSALGSPLVHELIKRASRTAVITDARRATLSFSDDLIGRMSDDSSAMKAHIDAKVRVLLNNKQHVEDPHMVMAQFVPSLAPAGVLNASKAILEAVEVGRVESVTHQNPLTEIHEILALLLGGDATLAAVRDSNFYAPPTKSKKKAKQAVEAPKPEAAAKAPKAKKVRGKRKKA